MSTLDELVHAYLKAKPGCASLAESFASAAKLSVRYYH